jgi:SAM-dependent methyltransferase
MDLVEQHTGGVRRHPWEVARSRFFLGLIERFGLVPRVRSWLDVGAGDAWFAGELHAFSARPPRDGGVAARPPERIVCWDINYGEDDLAAGRDGLELTAERPEGRFDAIVLLDVLEHVEDDRGFLDDIIGSFAAPGGWLVFSVPAHPSLFTAHDTALHHFRRYRASEARSVLEGAGLQVVAEGGLFHALAVARAAQALAERSGRRPESVDGIGGWRHGAGLTRGVTTVLEAENRLSMALGQRRRVVPGLSYWALART